ncbi:hypothetical protein KO495_02165 [Colwellia sp. D2M02]|uniref:DUF4064 domain-containing protein n=1 Tax=Colwellia asteriadis TaxID=517723 RepID=A0ABN1L3Z7_9GAMM|nr:hypothetical protein [Colwellia sp. D2M02]MBU2892127.1 hypothetical protein [Colwellia sp. D2M02]
MSFGKSLLLAIVATLFLTYVFGTGFLQFADVNITMDGEFVEPIQAISVSALVMLALVLVGLAIVLSVFGSFIFIAVMVVGTLAMVTIGIFWPILLIALLIWLVSKEKQPEQYS